MSNTKNKVIILKDYLNPEHAANLQKDLSDSMDEAEVITLDTKDVVELGTVQLQVLVAAVVSAQKLGLVIKWSELSEAMIDKIRLLGLAPHLAIAPN